MIHPPLHRNEYTVFTRENLENRPPNCTKHHVSEENQCRQVLGHCAGLEWWRRECYPSSAAESQLGCSGRRRQHPAQNRPKILPRETPFLNRSERCPLCSSEWEEGQGKQKKARKYATMKRMLSLRDQRLKEKDRLKPKKKEKKDPSALKEREVPQHPSCLFFQYNTQLGPPYHILVDTNFINFSIKAKLDLVQSMMDCLYAKCIPCITDCVMAEIEKLGQKYRVALRIAKDPRFERLPCTHKGTYADDCLVQRVTQHKCYIVATVDRDLKRRIRKIPGVPIMYISNHRYNIERMPDDYGAPRF
ncbi:rrna-processing protein fcf1 [Lynx pardinus]|nr:rrna-processing protein fcf1 [Lynx pardinus]